MAAFSNKAKEGGLCGWIDNSHWPAGSKAPTEKQYRHRKAGHGLLSEHLQCGLQAAVKGEVNVGSSRLQVLTRLTNVAYFSITDHLTVLGRTCGGMEPLKQLMSPCVPESTTSIQISTENGSRQRASKFSPFPRTEMN